MDMTPENLCPLLLEITATLIQLQQVEDTEPNPEGYFADLETNGMVAFSRALTGMKEFIDQHTKGSLAYSIDELLNDSNVKLPGSGLERLFEKDYEDYPFKTEGGRQLVICLKGVFLITTNIFFCSRNKPPADKELYRQALTEAKALLIQAFPELTHKQAPEEWWLTHDIVIHAHEYINQALRHGLK